MCVLETEGLTWIFADDTDQDYAKTASGLPERFQGL
jgi:hypothetical protein